MRKHFAYAKTKLQRDSCALTMQLISTFVFFLNPKFEASYVAVQPDVVCTWSETSEGSLKNLSLGFPTRSDTNQAVQSQKMARGLKFQILLEEGLYYPCGKNRGVDQLRSNCAADLLLCFPICKNQVFLWRSSYPAQNFAVLLKEKSGISTETQATVDSSQRDRSRDRIRSRDRSRSRGRRSRSRDRRRRSFSRERGRRSFSRERGRRSFSRERGRRSWSRERGHRMVRSRSRDRRLDSDRYPMSDDFQNLDRENMDSFGSEY